MLKLLLSFLSSVFISTCVFGIGNMLSESVSWRTILLSMVISLVANTMIIRFLEGKGFFYKNELYPMAFYHMLFVFVTGMMVVVISDKTYVQDAFDALSPYITLMIISFIHGFMMILLVKMSGRLV